MLKNDLVLRAARRERTERTPVWMMRQAGRTDPAYRALRERVKLPLEEMFRNPEIGAEVSMLPERIGVDAIIVFQDILTPLEPMGAAFQFAPGPQLGRPFRSVADLRRLHSIDVERDLWFVGREIELILGKLDGRLPLLGFAGGPMTLAFFLIEGGSPSSAGRRVRSFIREDRKAFQSLLDLLTGMTMEYLRFQIDHGVHAVQLFESLADRLTEEEYDAFAHPCHARIFAQLPAQVPKILFCKERSNLSQMLASGADVLSVGQGVDLRSATRQYGEQAAFQGNLDHQLVAAGSWDEIDAAVEDCIDAGGGRGHILNLSHGLTQNTPFSNVCRVVDVARRYCASRGTGARIG